MMPVGPTVLSVPALVVLNGLFVAAEFSLVSVRKTRVEELVRHGVQGAKAVEEVISRNPWPRPSTHGPQIVGREPGPGENN